MAGSPAPDPGGTAAADEPAALAALEPILIANRGEIAVRVQRTAQALGLSTVAVYTEADGGSPHIRLADRAERIGSYLDAEAILAAAARAGARSIHPGYGFLSESAGFAGAVAGAGLRWVGPPAAAIELMGDKARAKRLAREAGVPVVPGTEGGVEAPERQAEIAAFAAEHGFPVMVKALSGGGGKGMRVVGSEAELAAAIEGAAREAEAAFGDGRLLVERYIERPRHVEVQVLADAHGNLVHLGERECSLQRRHQKVIEEAPSPAVGPELRERLGEAALALTRACGYQGAGTVEFMVPGEGSGFFFLEMNTRLQVEHPVTELVWGVDLVEQQLRIAAGQELALRQAELAPDGHAVEARLYAEDPAAGFLPATGVIHRWREPTGPGLRVDAGVVEGSVIGTDYDPMLGKLIAHGPDRATAIGRLDRALRELELLGVASSASFSRALLAHPEVRAGRIDTGLLERALAELDHEPPADLLAAAAAVRFRVDTEAFAGISPGPWRRRFEGHGEVRIEEGTGVVTTAAGSMAMRVLTLGEGELVLELDGTARRYAVARDGATVWVGRDGHQLEARIEPRARTAAGAVEGSLQAPMPGKVLALEVANGERVSEGDLLMVLESMKMELQITAPRAGVVEGLELAVGERVALGQPLVAVAAADEGGEGSG